MSGTVVSSSVTLLGVYRVVTLLSSGGLSRTDAANRAARVAVVQRADGGRRRGLRLAPAEKGERAPCNSPPRAWSVGRPCSSLAVLGVCLLKCAWPAAVPLVAWAG